MDAAPHALHPSRRDPAGREEYWASLALKCCRHLGPGRSKMLLEAFGSARKAFDGVASWKDLGMPAKAVAHMRAEAWRAEAREHWDALKGRPDGVLLWGDQAYPAWLRNIPDPPLLLYFQGNLELLSNICVAIVGARDCTTEGLRTTVHIGRGLSEAGITIVSGMAMGIDRAAHLVGLEGVGASIGVLGTGLAVPYPRENLDLHALMRAKGLLVTEFAPKTPGWGGNFIVRNRIISGLARAVLVAEAAERSGSLNTARHALEQNRELMAVPGPASSDASMGCRELVRGGAKPVFGAEDVLRELLPFLRVHVREAADIRDRERPGGPAAPGEMGEDAAEGASGLGETSGDPARVFPLEMESGLLPWKCDAAFCPMPPESEPPRGRGRGRKTSRATGSKPGERILCEKPGRQSAPECAKNIPMADAMDRAILDFLCAGSRHVDDICRYLGQDPASVSRRLLLLEMRGAVRRLPGMIYGVDGTAC